MKTSVEPIEGTTVKLTVTVDAEFVDRAVERTYKDLSHKVRVPGFRPGKAPKPVVDNYLGREYVLAEATDAIVQDSYSQALDAEDLRPISSPKVGDIEPVEPGKEFTYNAEVELRPELELTTLEGLDVTVPPKEATDAEIDGQIEMMRDRFATLEPVEDRGIEREDFVLISFTGFVDDEPYEGNTVDKYLYEMNRGLMPPEFDEGLIGVKTGEQTTIEFEIPDTSSVDDYVGKKARFEVKVDEIKAKQLPALDDEFAGNVGGFDSMDDLRADLTSRLNVQKAMGYDRLKERAVRELVASRLEGDIPDAMIDQRLGELTRDFLTHLEQREMTIETYTAATGVDAETLEADLRVQAEASVREDLALEAIFRKLGMEVTQEDIDAELDDMAQASGQTADETRARWEELGLMPVVREQIMRRKAVHWLMDNAEVTEVDPAIQAAADASLAEEATESAESGSKKKRSSRKKDQTETNEE